AGEKCYAGRGLAARPAGIFTVPFGCFLAGRTEIPLAFTGSDDLPVVLRLPAEDHPAGDARGYECSDRGVREERAGKESVLDDLCCPCRDCTCASHGPGDCQGNPG